ncbi:MAG TPA: hypothetical protein VNK04_05815 [Gemmataceae bacterium]|nr:hypothetical protein [Gemmataceae bacterium]
MSIELITAITKLAFYTGGCILLVPSIWLAVLLLREKLREGKADDA